MAVFDYKDVGSNVSAALFKDALAITLYSYHNLDNGFAVGYQKNGMGTGLPATLVKAVLGGVDSQGGGPGIPWSPDSGCPGSGGKSRLEPHQRAAAGLCRQGRSARNIFRRKVGL